LKRLSGAVEVRNTGLVFRYPSTRLGETDAVVVRMVLVIARLVVGGGLFCPRWHSAPSYEDSRDAAKGLARRGDILCMSKSEFEDLLTKTGGKDKRRGFRKNLGDDGRRIEDVEDMDGVMANV
jgi:hypothetical protein